MGETEVLTPKEFDPQPANEAIIDINNANVEAAEDVGKEIRAAQKAAADADAALEGEEGEGGEEGEEGEDPARRRLSTGGGEDIPSDARRLIEIDKPATSTADSNILLLVPIVLAVGWLCYAIRKRCKRYVRPRLHSLRLVVVHM